MNSNEEMKGYTDFAKWKAGIVVLDMRGDTNFPTTPFVDIKADIDAQFKMLRLKRQHQFDLWKASFHYQQINQLCGGGSVLSELNQYVLDNLLEEGQEAIYGKYGKAKYSIKYHPAISGAIRHQSLQERPSRVRGKLVTDWEVKSFGRTMEMDNPRDSEGELG